MTDQTERQKAAARIAGAIAHELNNPLQGVLSLFALYKADQNGEVTERLEQIQGGLSRISQIISSISVIYENMPRSAEETSVEIFVDLLQKGLEERQIPRKVMIRAPRDLRFYALVPELVRLIREIFFLPSPSGAMVTIEVELLNGRALLTCERENSDKTVIWGSLDGHPVCSGLAVLLDEMTRLGGGDPEFRFDHSSLSGIRLCFRTRMN